MDFAISGKRAIVCASLKFLSCGCVIALAEAGVHVTTCARNEVN